MPSDTERDLTRGKTILAQWTGVLAAPAAWFLQLSINYVLVASVCESGNRFVLHIVTIGALLMAGFGAFLAWRTWQAVGAESAGEAGGAVARSRFLAASGLILSAFFGALILAQTIPSTILDPCR